MTEIVPLTLDRWDDLDRLFGPSGACSGCWCMWWRLTSKEFDAQAGDRLKRRFRDIVKAGPAPGLLAYVDGEPVGWVSIGHRDEFGRLNRSPKLKPVDDQPVCSVVCFFIHRQHRRAGLGSVLLTAAVDQARADDFETIEGYPIDTSTRSRPAADLFTGTLDLFEQHGFREVARRQGRPIVRRHL